MEVQKYKTPEMEFHVVEGVLLPVDDQLEVSSQPTQQPSKTPILDHPTLLRSGMIVLVSAECASLEENT